MLPRKDYGHCLPDRAGNAARSSGLGRRQSKQQTTTNMSVPQVCPLVNSIAACSLCGRPLELPEVVNRGALVHFACGMRETIHLPTLAEMDAAGFTHQQKLRQCRKNLAIRLMLERIGAESEVA